MPIATQCLAPGCPTKTIGPYCLEHEPAAAPRQFVRGRPLSTVERDPVDSVDVHELEPMPLVAA